MTISIHALLAESDNNGVLLLFGQPISIHALLAESDTSAIGFAVKTALFLSTLSLRRATADEFYVAALTNISIHALLAESDCIIMDKLTKPDGISIHALLAESDFAVAVNIKVMGNFYPRSPCGERPLPSTPPNRLRRISIHALLAESDPYAAAAKLDRFQFLSTLSLRRATCCPAITPAGITYFYPRSPCGERPPCPRCSRGTLPISIHALLAESDRPTTSCTAAHKHFYPRSPCGERHVQEALAVLAMEFLSTLSLRRATDVRRATGTAGSLISIHALLAESDAGRQSPALGVPYFYPRSPCGERQITAEQHAPQMYFYPRSPCGERPADRSGASCRS